MARWNRIRAAITYQLLYTPGFRPAVTTKNFFAIDGDGELNTAARSGVKVTSGDNEC